MFNPWEVDVVSQIHEIPMLARPHRRVSSARTLMGYGGGGDIPGANDYGL